MTNTSPNASPPPPLSPGIRNAVIGIFWLIFVLAAVRVIASA